MPNNYQNSNFENAQNSKKTNFARNYNKRIMMENEPQKIEEDFLKREKFRNDLLLQIEEKNQRKIIEKQKQSFYNRNEDNKFLNQKNEKLETFYQKESQHLHSLIFFIIIRIYRIIILR